MSNIVIVFIIKGVYTSLKRGIVPRKRGSKHGLYGERETVSTVKGRS